MNKNIVQIGLKTGKLVIPKEDTFKFPSLGWIYNQIENSGISVLFPNEEFFLSYLESLITDNNNQKADVLQALVRIEEEINDNGDIDNEEENDMWYALDHDEFSKTLVSNFKLLLELHKKENS